LMRLVQLKTGERRAVAVVEEPSLRLLRGFESVYALAVAAIERGERLPALVGANRSDEELDYDAIYQGRGEWRLLPAFDHPEEPARCVVSGTGLTHLGSAANRNAMHGRSEEELTDSMKMFRWGVEGGRPAAEAIGVAPEWFYKGNGLAVRAHGEPLPVPGYAEDGGEEAEMAAVFVVGRDGQPYRVGMAPGNEFADHQFEKRNYLNLAGSKLRACSLGPELTVDAEFESVPGRVGIERGGRCFGRGRLRRERTGDVPQPAESGAPPFQVRAASQAGGCAHPFSWRTFTEFWRWNFAAGWRCDGSELQGVWTGAAESGGRGGAGGEAAGGSVAGVTE
jgi:hypothetical protein